MVETVITVERTTTTQAAPSGGGGLSMLHINSGYFRTTPGIIKLIELLFGIICMGLASPALLAATSFFLFVVVVAFIGTLLWTFAYLLGIREALNLNVNWILTELLNTGIITVLYIIGFLLQLSTWSKYHQSFGYSSNIAAGVFGLFNTLVYAAGTYFLYLEHKNNATI